MEELTNLETETKLNDNDTSNGETTSKADTVNYLSPENIIYERGADATLQFGNGNIIKVNKTMLAFYSPVFAEIFFGLSPKTNVLVNEFDCEKFQTFLDHLFFLKQYTVIDALLIYPIAHKYQVKKSLDDCITKLTPNWSTEMDENVCLTLNLALLYDLNELTDSVMEYFGDTFGIVNLFERKDYFFLFEPTSVLKVIEKVKEMNSFAIEVLHKWSLNYLEKNNKTADIYSFFEENNILKKILLSSFESVNSIVKFQEVSKKKLFSSDEIIIYITNALSKGPKFFPVNSEWVKIKKGDILNEVIKFKQPFTILKSTCVSDLQLKIWFNNIFYEFIKNEDDLVEAVVYKVSYSFTNHSCQLDNESNNVIQRKTKEFYDLSNEIPKGKHQNSFDIESSVDNIISFDIGYTFNIDCRILKTSSLHNMLLDVDDKKLYFTCGIESC